MTLASDITPTRDIDIFRDALKGHELSLANAKKQRETILNDIRKASAASDMGDQRARLSLNALNKSDAEVGRLIWSIEPQVSEARKRVERAQAHSCSRQGGRPGRGGG